MSRSREIIAVRRVLLSATLLLGLISATSVASPTTAAGEPTTVCASHILVRYWRAHHATVVRSSETALVIAKEILSKALQPGADFDAVGKEAVKIYPDVLYERLGPFSRGRLQKEFEDVVFSLPPGRVADRVLNTPWGLHIIRRNPAVRCRHILVAYKGASRATVERTVEEARQLAEKTRQEALRPGADFAALAVRYSDAPDGRRGGDVGFFDRGMTIRAFEEAAFALRVGEISPLVHTRFGFHIIERIE